MSESSEDEEFDMELASILEDDSFLLGFAFEPRREDFPDLWNDEWGGQGSQRDQEFSDESSGGMSGAGSGTGSGTENGRGTPQSNGDSDGQSDRRGNTDWCECTNCVSMPTESECICCTEISSVLAKMTATENHYSCISDHPEFAIFTHVIVLQNTLWLIHHTRNDPVDYEDPRSLRWAAFKQFTAWIYGRLGRGVRRVIPACVVTNLRERYPNMPGTEYIGFLDFLEDTH